MKMIPQIKNYEGEIEIPGDKSISHRALIFSALANGKSTIKNLLNSEDVKASKLCLELLGIQFTQHVDTIEVNSFGKNSFRAPKNILNALNSGTTIRLLSGILAVQKFDSEITGDESLRMRPMKRIIDPLTKMGAIIKSNENRAPLIFNKSNKINSIDFTQTVLSAQVKSAILLAGLYANGETIVREKKLTRNHTENFLKINNSFENGYFISKVNNQTEINTLEDFLVPSDPSTAAFAIAMVLLSSNSQIKIKNVSINKTRIKYIELLKSLNANIVFENIRENYREEIADVIVKSEVISGNLILNEDIISDIIDEIPILAVISLFKNGTFKITGAKELRVKESDRISAICHNLKLLNVEVIESEDGFEFESKSNYQSVNFKSFNDHRIAMAFTIAGMKIGNCTIDNKEIVGISFPGFWDLVKKFS